MARSTTADRKSVTELEADQLRPPKDHPRLTAPVVGRLIQSGSGGGALVDFPGNPFGRPLTARTTTPIDASAVGGEAVLLFENGDPAKPIVVGALRPPERHTGVTAEIDGERV